MLQLVRGQAQHRAFDRVDALDVAVEEGRDSCVQFGTMRFHAAQQILEIFEVGDLHVLLGTEIVDDLAHGVAAQFPRVQRLHRTAARARARGRIDAVAALCPAHAEISCSSAAISIAASATSAPLLPCAPPARAQASASSSTASMPFNTGTPASSATRINPRAHSSATCS